MRYFKQKSKKIQRLALFLKGLCGTITVAGYYQAGSKGALIVMISGFVANELIEIFATPDEPVKNEATKGN